MDSCNIFILRRCLLPACVFFLLERSATCADTSLLSNVPEAAGYTLVYDLDIPNSPTWNSVPVDYLVNNASNINNGTFSRIAYYMELVSGTSTQWVYVSMNAFTNDAGKIGVPNVASGEFYNYAITGPITNATILSNYGGITTGTGINTINLEFWPSNYGTGNDYSAPGADAGTFDFGDGGAGASAGHGSMQIHNYGASQTLFAINGFNQTAQIGIGNQVSGNPDWTFNQNAGIYSVKRLQILVSGRPIINNSGVTGIKSTSAVLNGMLVSTGQAPTEVWAYYGVSDGGTTNANWSGTNYFGTKGLGALATNIFGLIENTTYYYRFAATNSAGASWAPSSTVFTTLPNVPIVSNSGGATGVTTVSALLNGTVVSTGSAPCYVWVMSGANNAGTNFTGWARTNYFGQKGEVSLSTNAGSLNANATYYYRYYGSNSFGGTWASTSSIFITGQITIQATDSNAAESGLDPGRFTILRPGTTTNEPIAVNYRISGTASNGLDYQSIASPLTIPAGATNADITITPFDDIIIEGPETAAITLLPGAYAVGTPSNAVVTTTDNDFKSNCRMKLKILFAGYNPPGGWKTLTNFPVLVALNESLNRFSYSDFHAPANGGDLRFMNSNETVHLNYEIEKWNTSGDSLVWVQVPELVNTNTCIWAYWRSPVDTNPPPCTTNGSTWDSNSFRAVWHMAATNGTTVKNSCNTGGNGTLANGSWDSASRIGNGVQIDAGNPSVSIGSVGITGPVARTISGWVKQSTPCVDWRSIFGFSSGGTSNYFDLEVGSTSNWVLHLNGWESIIVSQKTNSIWYHVAAMYDGNYVKAYLNGELKLSAIPPIRPNTTDNFMIAGRNGGGWSGWLDEVRVSSVAHSPEWIWTSWTNQASNSTFLTYGSGMDAVPRGSAIVVK